MVIIKSAVYRFSKNMGINRYARPAMVLLCTSLWEEKVSNLESKLQSLLREDSRCSEPEKTE